MKNVEALIVSGSEIAIGAIGQVRGEATPTHGNNVLAVLAGQAVRR